MNESLLMIAQLAPAIDSAQRIGSATPTVLLALAVIDILPDAGGAIVYQYTSATAVSASIAQLTMRKLAP